MSGSRSRAVVAEEGGSSGFALAVVLFFVLAVAAFITPLVLGARTDFLVASNKLQQDRLVMVAEGVVTVLARTLAATPVDAPGPELTLRSVPLRCEMRTLTVEVRLQDQYGLVDLNSAESGLLQAGFEALGFERETAERLAETAIAFRLPPEQDGERPDVDAGTIVGGLKKRPFEATEEVYDFQGLRGTPARAIAETFTIYNRRPTILGPQMPQRLSRILPVAPSPTYPFVVEENTEDLTRTYRIDVSVTDSDGGAKGFAGAIVTAGGDGSGNFDVLERVQSPEILPEEAPDFGTAIGCDRLLGVGAATFLAAAPG